MDPTKIVQTTTKKTRPIVQMLNKNNITEVDVCADALLCNTEVAAEGMVAKYKDTSEIDPGIILVGAGPKEEARGILPQQIFPYNSSVRQNPSSDTH